MFKGLRKITSWTTTLLRSRLAVRFGVAIFLLIVSAASFCTFYQKWSLREGETRFSAQLMLDGQAERPFVYRRLAPETANVLDKVTPARIKSAIVKEMFSRNSMHVRAEVANPKYSFRTVVLYWIAFFAMLGAGVAIYFMISGSHGPVPAMIGTAAFMCFYPILEERGGHVYDLIELFFLTLSILLARSKLAPALILLAPIAVYNKEAYVFFLPTLLPLLWARYSGTQGGTFRGMTLSGILYRAVIPLGIIGSACVAAGVVYLLVKMKYAHNVGSDVDVWFLENLKWYANPVHLGSVDWTYGLPWFAAYSIVTIVILAFIAANGLPAMKAPERWHLFFVFAVNTPLFIVLAYHSEVRNYSLTFPALALLTGAAVDHIIRSSKLAVPQAAAGEAPAGPVIVQSRAQA
jgi:hypothetical protein